MRELSVNEMEQINGGIYKGSGACGVASFSLFVSAVSLNPLAIIGSGLAAYSACM